MTPAFLVVLLMLVGASWSDLLTRRVPNQYWWPFVAMAPLLWLSGPGDHQLVRAGGAAAMTVLVYVMWRLGTFGGADAKGLMVFAWLWPGVPDLLGARTLPVLDTLVNATLIAIALPFLFLALNLVRGDLAFPAALLGTRMPLSRAQRRHVWPMQHVALAHDVASRDAAPADALPTGPGQPPLPSRPTAPPPATPGPPPLRWRYWHRPGDDLEAAYDGLRAAGVQRVWVTPKIPFMVPLAAASVATWAWGNWVLRLLVPT